MLGTCYFGLNICNPSFDVLVTLSLYFRCRNCWRLKRVLLEGNLKPSLDNYFAL